MSEPSKSLENSPGYETSDAGVAGIMWSGVALFALMVFAFVLIWFVLDIMNERHAEATKPASPLYTGERVLPPEPRLQVSPETDNRAAIAVEDSIVQGYGWISREEGIVRIPVTEAMKITVEQGLPVRPQQ